MHFVEVAVQHVRGFSPALRLSLPQGYAVLRPPAAPAAPLATLAAALLYADGRGADVALAVAGKAAKAALSLVGQDGVTYRVLRQLGGGGGLHRLHPATGAPELLTQDALEAGQLLRAHAGLPTRAAFEQLFCLGAGQLPSRRPRLAPAPTRVSQTGLSSLQQAVAPAADVAAARAQLAALEAELAGAREVEVLQSQQDALAHQVFQLEAQLQGSAGLRAALQEAEAAAAAAPSAEGLGLPPDIVQRAERYPRALARRTEALARLEAEREAAAGEPPAGVEPLVRNRLFLGGAVGGLFFLGVGLWLQGQARYVALLDIPAFGAAAVGALRYVEDLQRLHRSGRKEEVWAQREAKVEEEFEAEAAPVRAAMKALRVDAPGEVAALLGQRELLALRAAELRAQLEALEADAHQAARAQRHAQLKAEHDALGAQLAERGAYARDVREVERELERVRASIALASAPPPPAASAGVPAGELLEDPSPGLLTLAADLLAADVGATAAALRERCVQYLSALTDRRYAGVEWDREGRGRLLAAAGGAPVGVGALPPRDADLYCLALRLTVVERVSARHQVPLLLEDPFAGVEEARLPLLARMLKHLGSLTQVLHVTAHPGFAQVAGGAHNL